MVVQKFDSLEDAIELAKFAHRKQTDQAGMPYIEHPLRVMRTVQAQGAMPYVQMAAVLHDCTEDSKFTCQMLLDLGVSEAAVEIVKLVDRDYSANLWNDIAQDEDNAAHYDNLIALGIKSADDFYYHNIRFHPGALMVKAADIADNLQEYRLVYLSEKRQDHLRKKYRKARIALGLIND